MRIETDAPPVAQRKPGVRDLHGETAVDDYAWMRKTDEPALLEYLRAERDYYDTHTRHLAGLVDKLAGEAAGRYPAGDEYSVGWPRGEYTYRTRLPEKRDNVELLRVRTGESSEQVLLDENLLAKRTGYIDVEEREPSPDGALLAWSADVTGAEFYELRIRDLESGEDLPEVISPTLPGVAWSTGSDYLFYLVPDELHRPFQVWRHRVGASVDSDQLVFEERDQTFELALRGSRSGELAIITAYARVTTEVWLVSLERPLEDAVLIQPRRRGLEYAVDHERGGDLYVVSNLDAEEFALMRSPASSRDTGGWRAVNCPAIAPARDDTRLLRCDVLESHLLLTARRDGGPLLLITDHDGDDVREIPPGPPAGSIRVDHAEEYDNGSVIIVEESFVEPPVWSELELATGSRRLLKRLEVPGYDPDRYRTQRLMAPARDGTPIPVTLAWRDDVELDGSAPCLLYGYGAYEDSIDPMFDRSLPSLLDRGVVFAVAHIRGGGECGRRWWLQGRLHSKPTTFTDYIDVADWLAGSDGRSLIDGTRIVSMGASAGGLLQGAVFSMRPDRWRAVVAEVPFVDCVTTMLDDTIPLTTQEWDEWGDPREPDDYACIRSYSPYDNPPAGHRPPLMVTGAVNDARVGIHEPAKWVARLRATGDNGSRLLFRAELGVGAHSGPSGRSARLRYEAEVQAFILEAMGVTQ